MLFEPLYYQDRLKILNPSGDISVVTLWSRVDAALDLLKKAGVDQSRISVVANLYGNGLPQMLANLLWNPQIRHIVVLGKNLSGSREWLSNFFRYGVEEIEFLGVKALRIRNTQKILDYDIRPEFFSSKPTIRIFGDIGSKETEQQLRFYLETLPTPNQNITAPRVQPPPIKQSNVVRFPSDPANHSILRDTPLEAWKELVFRLVRFGYRNKVAKHSPDGQPREEERIELQNLKVIVRDPDEEPADLLAEYGFDLSHFKEYQKRILDGTFRPDLSYTYGNRLRGYFRHQDRLIDCLEICTDRLKQQPDSRHAYISLWDSNRDLPVGGGCPCFVSAFFRLFDNKLTMTATFRVHNAVSAWLENFYGLVAIQKFVSERAGFVPGPITVISHSISVDVDSLERAKQVAAVKITDDHLNRSTGKYEPRMDPNGDFTVTIDRSSREIIVEHSIGGVVLKQYRGKSAEEIERQLARDCAVSEISHALYLGREIARKEEQIRRFI